MKKMIISSLIILSLLCSNYAASNSKKKGKDKKEYTFIEIEAKDFSINKAKENNWEALIINNAAIDNLGGVRIVFTGGSTNEELICFYLNPYTSTLDFEKETGYNGMSEDIKDTIYNKIRYTKPYYKIKVILNKYSIQYENLVYGELIEIEGIEEAEEKIKIAEEQEKQRKQAEKAEKIKKITKGYVYHGEEEVKNNIELFKFKGLKQGHAYFISGFTPDKIDPTSYVKINTLITTSSIIGVKYLNQDVRVEVLKASSIGNGYLPVTVIVTVDKSSGKPLVLGVIE